MGKLSGCVNDANEMLRVLSKQQSGFLVKPLLEADATRSEIRKQLQWVIKESDFSIVYFAGHGIKTPIGTYLTPHDGDEEDGVDVAWIQSVINGLAVEDQTVVVILDCCHSGATPIGAPINGRPIDASDLPHVRGRGRVLLAACGSEQTAKEIYDPQGTHHGRFSHHLVRALEGYAANENGTVTLSAAYDYVARQFGDEQAQMPVFRGDYDGVIELAVGVKPLGNWRPPADEDYLEPALANAKAADFLGRVLSSIQASAASHIEWQERGYRQACATYEPVRRWFMRVIDRQPELLADAKFSALNRDLLMYGQQLGTVSPGTQLPQGKVVKSLGAGTFGSVLLISNAGESSQCLKVFHANDLHQGEKVARFRRGYQAMRQMDHPAIVKVRELSEVPLGFFMDYIAGANARDFTPGIVSEPSEIVRLLLQVAETLQHAHGKQVIHRDVKPENILISFSDSGETNAFLTDFDLAWFDTATKLTKLADGFGSQFYAAPEQMARPNSPAARSGKVDVFSFGQLVFFFITGRDPVPMDGESNSKVLQSALAQHWTEPRQADTLHNFYRDATQQDPKLRPSSFRDICQMLAEILLGLQPNSDEYELGHFMRCLRFTVCGDFSELPTPAVTTLRSRSGNTEVVVYIATENQDKVALDVAFHPDSLDFEGMRSQDARQLVNHRIDAAIQSYLQSHAVRRTGSKGGGFEANVRIENLAKKSDGVLRACEIISKVIDAIERR